MLPELLRLNASGHPNGHTPFSAYLALAALLAGYLRGSPMVLPATRAATTSRTSVLPRHAR